MDVKKPAQRQNLVGSVDGQPTQQIGLDLWPGSFLFAAGVWYSISIPVRFVNVLTCRGVHIVTVMHHPGIYNRMLRMQFVDLPYKYGTKGNTDYRQE
jgi:hypothetical protein